MRIIHKALGFSLLVHMAIMVSLVVFSFVLPKKRYTPVYQVSLVTQPEPKPTKPVVQPQEKKPPVKKPPKPEKKASPPKEKETRLEKKASPTPNKQTKTAVVTKQPVKKQSIERVERRIEEIKKKMAAQQETEQDRLRTSRILETRRNAYFDTIAAHIQANWSLLKNQRENVGALRTDIGLHIQRDGTVTQIVIEKPSGNISSLIL